MKCSVALGRCVLRALLVISLSGCAVERTASFHETQTAESLIDQGVAFLRVGDFTRARMRFLLSYEIKASAAALDGIGCVDLLLGEFVRAQKSFHQVRTAYPEYSRAWVNNAVLHMLQGHKTLAENMLRQAIALDPTSAEAYNNLGIVMVQSGRVPDARAQFFKAEAILDHPLVAQNLENLNEE